VYWAEEPPATVRRSQEERRSFADLAGTLDRFDAAGLELVEMLLANSDDWDRYQASQWMAASDWVAAHPDDPDAGEVGRMTDEWRRSYVADLRRCMGWGVFGASGPVGT
jgi:predicted ATP-grasp superfamily ATP-dependent carboligase